MESEGEIAGKSVKKPSQVCQICGDNVGEFADGEPFVACDVCTYPVCRACYDYERKKGKNSCPSVQNPVQEAQRKSCYSRRSVDVDDSVSDINYNLENENQKQKVAERIMSWHIRYGHNEDVSAPNYEYDNLSHHRYTSSAVLYIAGCLPVHK